jgi:hypothetical protein
MERSTGGSAFHRGGMLGVAGALGGIAGGIIAASVSGPQKYAMYDITATSTPTRLVRVGFPLGFEVGQCVQLLVESAEPEKQVFLITDASLRPSKECQTEP